MGMEWTTGTGGSPFEPEMVACRMLLAGVADVAGATLHHGRAY